VPGFGWNWCFSVAARLCFKKLEGTPDGYTGEVPGEKWIMSCPFEDGRLGNDTGHPFGVNTI
jgi:hypothetical protein